mmetsp:Transcript_61938/g.178295  ORF Transcript_61938/g.178295 Transcript_61938/m.178295 type:complete len:120 (-) Transcript_61938:176-535(-)
MATFPRRTSSSGTALAPCSPISGRLASRKTSKGRTGRPPAEASRERFSIGSDPAFERLRGEYADVLSIVEGMLQKSPAERWSAEAARSTAEKIAESRGLRLVPPPAPITLPGDWSGDFQ